MESALTISAEKCFATEMLAAVFPTPVGPQRTTTFCCVDNRESVFARDKNFPFT